MMFSEIINRVLRGEMAYRQSEKGTFIYLDDDGMVKRTGPYGEVEYLAPTEDLRADDWKVI